MVKTKDLYFLESKKLHTVQILNDFGIEFNPANNASIKN